MSRERRLEMRLTPEEREAYEWAARFEGLASVAAWLRQNANLRIRKLKREALDDAAQKIAGAERLRKPS